MNHRAGPAFASHCTFVHCIRCTQESNWGLLHCRRILYQLSYQGSPIVLSDVIKEVQQMEVTIGREMSVLSILLGLPYRKEKAKKHFCKTKFPYQFSSVAQLCPDSMTPWTAACQASLSITNSRSLPKLLSIELVMTSNYFILCCPLLLLPSIFPSIRVFSNESALHIRWPKYWSFSFNISPSSEYPGLISFRMDWLSPCSPRDSQESSPTPQFKSINSLALSFIPHIHTWLLENTKPQAFIKIKKWEPLMPYR